jgi:hypothetical protein
MFRAVGSQSPPRTPIGDPSSTIRRTASTFALSPSPAEAELLRRDFVEDPRMFLQRSSCLGLVVPCARGPELLPARQRLLVDAVSFPTLLADGSAEGTATHLGRFAAEFNATVNILDGTSTGSFTRRSR